MEFQRIRRLALNKVVVEETRSRVEDITSQVVDVALPDSGLLFFHFLTYCV